MAKKPYSPVASYDNLLEVENLLKAASTADEIRQLVTKHGPKVGYKAFCYILGGKMSAAAMKPDEAAIGAATLEQKGETEAALAIYKEIVVWYPDHPIAKEKVVG